MTEALTNWQAATPEIFLLSMACIILVIDLFLKQEQRGITYVLTQLSLAVSFIISFGMLGDAEVTLFYNTFIHDQMSVVLKLCVYIAAFVVFVYTREYLKYRDMYRGEYYVLGLFGVIGMMILISANNMLTIYLGLELLSLSMYAMVALQRDNATASESAMKYFVLGAIASGMLLYGMSMIYGMTGSLDLTEISQRVATVSDKMILVFGIVFLMVGIAFKLGAVPFHMWVPDVYQGSPTAVTLYIATAPKIAAFAMMIRLLVTGLIELHQQWQGIVIILAVLSMGIGNIVAISQTNIKRMLAYSAISHIGFLMLGVLSGTPEGFASAMFYTMTYVLMSLGGFGMVLLLSRKGFEADQLEDYRGLNQRSPWYALMMLILMFSMAGVPPFVGFWAKLAVLKSVVAADMVWLAGVAVLFSIIGAFYYLRMIKIMYFDRAEEMSQGIESSMDVKVLISGNALLVLIIGLFPGELFLLCKQVIGS